MQVVDLFSSNNPGVNNILDSLVFYIGSFFEIGKYLKEIMI